MEKDSKTKESIYDLKVLDTDKSKIPLRKAMKSGVVPRFPCSVVITGSSGSGKSVLMLNMLTRKEFHGNYYHTTIIFSPTAGDLDDQYKVLGDIPKENFIKEFTEDTFNDILEARKELIKKKGIGWVAKNSRVCLILDDCIAERSFLNGPSALRMFVLLRHYLCSVFLLTQSYTKCPRALRLNANATYLFPSTQSEVQIMLDEICPANMKKREFEKVIDYCCGEQYSFLSYNRHAKPNERIRKNLTEIVNLDKYRKDK